MEKKPWFVIEWKIQNLSHWCPKVHGNAIVSPKVVKDYCNHMELYPRGFSGQGNQLLARFCGIKCSFSGNLSYIAPDKSILYTRKVNANAKKTILEHRLGPNFEEVLAQIVKIEDQITVRFGINDKNYHRQFMCTTINVIKLSLKLDPKELIMMQHNADNCIIQIPFTRFNEPQGLILYNRFDLQTMQFMIEPKTEIKCAISVDICMSLINSEDTIKSGEEKKNIFSNKTRWTFADKMVLRELLQRDITILMVFKIKSRYMVKSHIGFVYIYKAVSLLQSNDPCISDKSITCTKTEDSVAVLSKDFSSLFQDQDFSDLLLKSGDESFPVHKAILSPRSPVFKRLLSSDMKETASGEVDIGDIDPPTLARFLAFLYTGTVKDLQVESALKLYYAADKYEVLSLRRDCSDFLRANVSIQNVCDILSFADRHLDENLLAVSKNFILDNFSDVLKSKEWEALAKSEPLLAVNTLTHFAVKDRIGKT